MTVYDRIRELRIAAGLTQSELADRLGYSETSMILSGNEERDRLIYHRPHDTGR
jgi:transcriptional regulator with XRE-family HTH domain